MASPSSTNPESPAFPPFTRAERIQQLNDIDKVKLQMRFYVDANYARKKLHELLRSAGLAVQTLTEARRQDVESATNNYLQVLQAVDVGLRRQIYGLEEAEIIPPEKKKKVLTAEELNKKKDNKSGFPGAASAAEATVTEGGMGKLDIGWLNSNSGRVGRDMEAELWSKARKFLEGQEKGNNTGVAEHEDTEMLSHT
jgi:hypothetical protein